MFNSIFQAKNALVSFRSPLKTFVDQTGPSVTDHGDENGYDHQEFNIRLANSASQRESATLLLKKMYSWRGYSIEEAPESTPRMIMLAAETAGRTVGTMTLCLDGDFGLPADGTFPKELDALRAQKRRLTEPSRLAIDQDTPKRVFAAMIHIAYIFAYRIHGYSDFIIEVNPRHAAFYKRMLGFEELAGERTCARVDAPAVLLRLDFDHMRSRIASFGGLFETAGRERSFYPYFFSLNDEIGIQHRLETGQT